MSGLPFNRRAFVVGAGAALGALPIVVGDLGMTLSPGAAFSADATAQPV